MYIIDGTNLCNLIPNKKSLATVLQTILEITKKGEGFICYFDANTRKDHLTEQEDRDIYSEIISKEGLHSNVCDRYFIEVNSGIQADREILGLANEQENTIIISTDLFNDGKETAHWTKEKKEKRIHQPLWVANRLTISKSNIDVPFNSNTIELALELVTELERKNNNLKGKIHSYNTEKQWGFIETNAGNRLFFHRNSVNNPNLDFTETGKLVSFEITIAPDKSGKYRFRAKNLKAIENEKDLVETLKEQIQILQAGLDEANKRIEILENENTQLKEDNLKLESQNKEMQAEIDRLRKLAPDSIKELEQEILKLKYKITQLEELNLNYRIKIEFLEEEIKMLIREKYQFKSKYDIVIVENNNLLQTIEFLKLDIKKLEDEVDILNNFLSRQKENNILLDYEKLKIDYNLLLRNFNDLRIRFSAMGNVRSGTQADEIKRLTEEIERLENEIKKLKQLHEEKTQHPDKGENPTNPSEPVVPPKPPEETGEKEVLDWWNSLSKHWRKVFSYKFSIDIEAPNPDKLKDILESEEISIMGPATVVFTPLTFKVEDISGILGLKKLKKLNLSFNKISNLDGIEKLEHLEEINLLANKLGSIKGLEKLPNLQKVHLDLNDNLIQEEIENLRKSKPNLIIEGVTFFEKEKAKIEVKVIPFSEEQKKYLDKIEESHDHIKWKIIDALALAEKDINMKMNYFNEYIEKFPDGIYVNEARKMIAELYSKISKLRKC